MLDEEDKYKPLNFSPKNVQGDVLDPMVPLFALERTQTQKSCRSQMEYLSQTQSLSHSISRSQGIERQRGLIRQTQHRVWTQTQAKATQRICRYILFPFP